jgi:hypothetical protein
VRIRSVTVGPETIDAVVAFEPGEPLRTSEAPGAAEVLLRVLPGLRGHRCENDTGTSFAEELADTEIAHALEHAALEIAAMAGSPVTLRGRTTWDFAADGPGVFRVALEYDDDLVVLGSLAVAADVVRAATGEGAAPDVAAETSRLRGLRKGK